MLLSCDCDWEILICDIRHSLFDRERVATHESDSRWNEEKQCLIRFLNLSRLINRVSRRLAKELYLDQASWTLVFLLSSSTDVTHFEGVSRDIPQERLQRRLSRLHWSYYSCVTSFALLAWSCPSCTGLGFLFFFCLFLFLYVLPRLALFIFLFPLFALLQLVRTCVKSYRILSSLPPSATNLNQRRETEQHEKIRGVMFF